MEVRIERFEIGDHIYIHATEGRAYEGTVVSWVFNEHVQLHDHESNVFIDWDDILELEVLPKKDKYIKQSCSNILDKHVEAVNHPSHYQSESGLEVFDVIEAFTADLKGVDAFDMGNVIKYVCRWKHKNGLEDLKKAMVYLERVINRLEKEND